MPDTLYEIWTIYQSEMNVIGSSNEKWTKYRSYILNKFGLPKENNIPHPLFRENIYPFPIIQGRSMGKRRQMIQSAIMKKAQNSSQYYQAWVYTFVVN